MAVNAGQPSGTRTSTLSRLTVVELGCVMAFLGPQDLHTIATSVSTALSTAAAEAWELWRTAALRDVAAAAKCEFDTLAWDFHPKHLTQEAAEVRSVEQWQWCRVLIAQELFHATVRVDHHHGQRCSVLQESDVAAFLRSSDIGFLTAYDSLSPEGRTLSTLMPLSEAGRREALYPVIQAVLTDSMKTNVLVETSEHIFFVICCVGKWVVLTTATQVTIAASQSRFGSWCVTASIAALNHGLTHLSPGLRAVAQEGSSRAAEMVSSLPVKWLSSTLAFATTRALMSIQGQTVQSGRQAQVSDASGTFHLVTAYLAVGLVSGVVAALCRRSLSSRSLVFSSAQSPLARTAASFADRAMLTVRRAKQRLTPMAWSLFFTACYGVVAVACDDLLHRSIHAVALLDVCLRRSDKLPCASTTFKAAAALWTVGSVVGLLTYPTETSGAGAGAGVGLSRRQRRRAQRRFVSPNTRQKLWWAFHGLLAICTCTAGLRAHYDSSFGTFGYYFLSAFPALSVPSSVLPTPSLQAICDASAVGEHDSPSDVISKAALVSFVASRPLVILFQALVIDHGTSIIEASKLLRPSSTRLSSSAQTVAGALAQGRRWCACCLAVKQLIRRRNALLPPLVAAIGFASAAAAESRAALRCEVSEMGASFVGSVVFALGTTVGDAICTFVKASL